MDGYQEWYLAWDEQICRNGDSCDKPHCPEHWPYDLWNPEYWPSLAEDRRVRERRIAEPQILAGPGAVSNPQFRRTGEERREEIA